MKRYINSALSLKVKLPLSIVLIVAITLAISTVFTLYNFASVVHSVRNQHLESTAQVISESIYTQIRQAGRDMVMAASLPGVLQAVELPPISRKSPKYAATHTYINTLFERMLLAYGYYNALYMVNEAGEFIVGTTPTARDLTQGEDSVHFRNAMKKSGFSVGPTIFNDRIQRVLVPIFLEIVYNGYNGALVSSLHITKIVDTALQDLPHTDINPVVFSLNNSSIVHINSNIQQVLTDGPWTAQLQGKPSGVLNVYMNGQDYTIGFAQVPQTDIYAVAVAKDTYMLTPAMILRNTTLITNIVAVLIIMLCVCYFTIPLTRDIAQLSFFAKSVSEGQDNQLLQTPRRDEIGHLNDSLGKMVSTLKDMVVRSEAATKAKSEFLACMSHEIRTPMNGILGMTYLALRANPEEKQKKFLERIDTAAKTLLGVIDDILDFSKIEAEKMDINFVTFRLSDIITSMRDMLQPKSEEKGIMLNFSVDDDVPDILYSDPLRFTQICINLCSNAIKFTAEGEVHMHVSLVQRNEDNLVIQVSVKDTGIGLAEAEQKHIFDSFAQADSSTTRKYGGTGLGLTISKSLTHLLGGKIWLESVVGKGSTFSFTITATEGLVEDLQDSSSATPTIDYALPNLKILLVEDNEINQEIALEILKSMGANVTLAKNGVEAVYMFEKGDFDMILMDIQMPIMDGMTATNKIRNSKHARALSIPIVAMTAHAMTGDKEKSLQAGMNDHITKPLNIDELYNVLMFWGATSRTENMFRKV